MEANETIKNEFAQGDVTLSVCLKNAVFVAEFRKLKIESETSKIFEGFAYKSTPKALLDKYGINLGKPDFDFRRTLYENVIKTLHDRIRQLDEDQAAYTRGLVG